MTAQFGIIVRLPIKPERRDEFEKLFFDVIDTMAHEEDFINTVVGFDNEDPDTFVLYETWACTPEYFVSHHLKASYRAAYEAAFPDLLKRERTIEFVTPIRTYPNRIA